MDYVNNIMAEGFSITQLLSQLHDAIVNSDDLSDRQKSVICEKMAVSEARLIDGASEYIQLLDITSVFMNQISKS